MEDQDFERIYFEAKNGNSVHLNPDDRVLLLDWARRNGKVIEEDKLIRLQKKYEAISNERNLPSPRYDIGYPTKGYYEEIYKCLIAENFLSAAILSTIMVEFALKSAAYSFSVRRFEFSRTEWGNLKLDEQTFGPLLNTLKGKVSQRLFVRLTKFKVTRNNLTHANIVKT